MGKIQVESCPELSSLKDLKGECPKELYYLGKWEAKIFEKCVGIVGSRRMTSYGLRVLEKMVPTLVQEGYTIVSGFMYGVDQTAHRLAVECGGKTIGVLGWGIDEPLYGEEKDLASKMLVISEWEDKKGALWTFPRRNRIVAGLIQKLYVIEATVKSGSMISVEWAEKLKREIWAVPGSITSKVSEGTNRLISDGRAKMWTGDTNEVKRSTNNTEIYILLQNEVLTIDELVRKTGRSAQELGAELMMAMLRGEVSEKDGKYYVIEN